jgi:hypothetical protein
MRNPVESDQRIQDMPSRQSEAWRPLFGLHRNQQMPWIGVDRYGRVSTLVAAQVPVADCFVGFPDPTLGDGILDRIIHEAYNLNLEREWQ